jgi:acetyl esterase/lipase
VTGDSPGPADGVSVARALTFAALPGYRPLQLDLFRPESDGPSSERPETGRPETGRPETGRPLPAVVYLHGGGWRQGARDMTSPAFRDWRPGLLARVASAGFAVVCPDYRLSGEARFPAQLDDVHRALDWVTGSGAEHGIDPDRILLWGDSAGGHLATLAALRGEPRPAIRGVVAWYPVTDLAGIQADAEAIGGEPHNTADARETALLGGLICDLPALAADASPVSHVAAATAPFLLAHGTADRGVPFAQSARLRDALLAADAEVSLHAVEGADHMWQGASDEQLHRLFDVTLSFLRVSSGSAG